MKYKPDPKPEISTSEKLLEDIPPFISIPEELYIS
jgi:hypothetical protein